jgi:hypothetical protein
VLNSVVMFPASANSNGIVLNVVLFGKLQKVELAASCESSMSTKSWNRVESAVGGLRHPQHTQTGSNSATIASDSSNGVTNTRCCRYSCICAPDDGWKYHPKHLEQFPDINKLCDVASCWIYLRCTYP